MANILVVEDYTATQRLLGYLLQVGGHQVTTADNGQEALTKLPIAKFDLMIIDLIMPKMDGLTLLREIRADEQYNTVPVIILTASDEDAAKREALAVGANTFLTKPISSTELSETVQMLLAG